LRRRRGIWAWRGAEMPKRKPKLTLRQIERAERKAANKAAWRDPVQRRLRWPERFQNTSPTLPPEDPEPEEGSEEILPETGSLFDSRGSDESDLGLWLSHERRATMHGGLANVTSEQLRAVRHAFGGLCVYCAKRPAVTLDHIIPLRRGGDHAIWNLVMTCQECNSSKRDRDLETWCTLHGLPFAAIESRIRSGRKELERRFGEDAMRPRFDG
jgi:5-methylcytosine-specific restriction endonuclease McrA